MNQSVENKSKLINRFWMPVTAISIWDSNQLRVMLPSH